MEFAVVKELNWMKGGGVHGIQRNVLFRNYKAYKAAVDSFPEEKAEQSIKNVKTLSSLERVRASYDILKTKRRSLQGCIKAKECFFTRFYGNDMDFGTRMYGRLLQRKSDELDTVIAAIEERYQELLLSAEGALWVLDGNQPSGVVSQFFEACCEYPESTLEEARLPAPKDKGEHKAIVDPVEEGMKRKRYAMIIGIWDYIASLCTPPESLFFRERLNIIHAHIARCICSDATLFLTARKYKTVEDFLRDLNLDVLVLEKLIKVLSQHNVHCIRAAIDDILRPEDDTGEYFTFLGMKLHRHLGETFPFHAWGHWAVFFPSPCLCAVKKSFSKARQISLSSKYMQLHGIRCRRLSQYHEKLHKSISILDLCGIHVAYLDPGGLRHSIEKVTESDGRCHWIETQHTIAFHGSIAFDEPLAGPFVAACTRRPDFMIRIRRGPNDEVANFPEVLWSCRFRHARTFGELDQAFWKIGAVPKSEQLSDCQRYLSNGMPLKDCLEFEAFDTSDCDFDHALFKLAKICLDIHGVKDLDGLYKRFISSYVKEGELQLDDKGEVLAINCLPEEAWLMRMYLLGAELPAFSSDHISFSNRFL
ncbi:hypothetical protein WG66_001389 [Moniliophthora roreri]|uniref:Uncharacterized protein n=1 Tax=Moniliophthora roreri TaxID=221103 RepID=A0A0W0F0Z2_MONRR|nr:hypothetical protein WG66_001389 [Moniliophthora roreri]